ncbi:MAG TPA: Gfo/Idh/MocA family oxidoreductase [Mycobacteriales bacterium]|nr:Gfo/Idh/MocA family oxidoreductase [Mycobacteriales bacterium]
MRRLRVGLAGLGRMGLIHSRNLAWRCPSAQLVAVTDADAATAARVGAELGVPVAPSYDDLLSDVDAVAVATPTATHADLAVRAARAEWRTPGQASYGLVRDFQERYPWAYAEELESFARSVLDGVPPRVTGADALAAFDLARAADRAWRTGLPVAVKPHRSADGVEYDVDGPAGVTSR